MKRFCYFLTIILLGTGAFFLWRFHTAPMVSVVMPTYNRAELLPLAIESVLAQTYKDFELIIVDDSSTDQTQQLIQNYMKKEPRIRLLTNETNKGISYSRNRGQEAARGKYIGIMDSDDKVLPDWLNLTVQAMEDHPDWSAVAGVLKYVDDVRDKSISNINNTKDYYIQKYPNETPICMLFSNCMINVSSLIRRSFVIKNNIQYQLNLKSAEDYDYWIQMIKKGGKIARLSQTTVFARAHAQNKPDYYNALKENSERMKRDFQRLFYPVSEDQPILFYYSLLQQCKMLDEIIRKNQIKASFIDIAVVKSVSAQMCPSKEMKTYYLKHPGYQDYFVITKKDRGYLYQSKNEASFHLKKNKLTLKWDEFGTETFLKQNDEIYQLEDFEKKEKERQKIK